MRDSGLACTEHGGENPNPQSAKEMYLNEGRNEMETGAMEIKAIETKQKQTEAMSTKRDDTDRAGKKEILEIREQRGNPGGQWRSCGLLLLGHGVMVANANVDVGSR